MNENPYEATVVHEKTPRPRKTFSWVAFMIVLLGGQFLYLVSFHYGDVDDPFYLSSSMTFRTFIIALVSIAVGKLAARF